MIKSILENKTLFQQALIISAGFLVLSVFLIKDLSIEIHEVFFAVSASIGIGIIYALVSFYRRLYIQWLAGATVVILIGMIVEKVPLVQILAFLAIWSVLVTVGVTLQIRQDRRKEALGSQSETVKSEQLHPDRNDIRNTVLLACVGVIFGLLYKSALPI